MSKSPYGVYTRKLRNIWFNRVGPSSAISGDRVQLLFNDMDLFPSKNQVHEMLCCAGKCGNHGSDSGTENLNNTYLTYGEFSLFASEMKRAYQEDSKCVPAPASKIAHKIPNNSTTIPNNNENKKLSNPPTNTESNSESHIRCEVFLGGSCNPTTWRQEVAIPMLKKHDISYFNPQVTTWHPQLMELEHQAKTNANVLFFVIDNQTRGIAGMIEVAYLLGKNRKIVLVISGLRGPGQTISNEIISNLEYEDLTNGQLTLSLLVERHGIPVFTDIDTALKCTKKIIGENLHPQDLKLSDLAQPIKMGHVQIGNKLNNLKKIFESLDSKNKGEINLSDIQMGYRILSNGKDLTKDEVIRAIESIKKVDKEILDPPRDDGSTNNVDFKGENGFGNDHTGLNFEKFCCIMTELLYSRNSYLESENTWSNVLATKSSKFVQSITLVLTRLLEYVPGSNSAPSWLNLSHLNPNSNEIECVNDPLYDVYLGGPWTSQDKWRSENAIPLLKKNGLTYLNPETSQITRNLLPIDANAIDKCRLLFFYLTSNARSVENMAMAAYYFGRGCHIVVCISYLQDECQIEGETLSKCAVKDYNRGRSYLSDMANREGISVFEDIHEALDCIVEKSKALKNSSNNNTNV